MDNEEQKNLEEVTADNEESTPEANAVSTAVTDKQQPHMPVVWQLGVLSCLLTGVFLIGASPQIYALWKDDSISQTPVKLTGSPSEAEQITSDPFAELSLAARSVVVLDVRNDEVLFEKDPDTSLPLASVTKLMTGLTAKELILQGSNIIITDEAVAQDGNSGLRAGEFFRYEELSDLTLLTSSNDGAYALAAAAGQVLDESDPAVAFVKAMNVRAKELELDETYFRNPTGLDLTETESGAYGSASDMAKLLAYIVVNHPELLEATTVDEEVVYNNNREVHQVQNTNRVVNNIPGLIGSKTGYTELAGGNLVIAFDAGMSRPVVIVVLGSTHQGRFADVLQLVQATRDKLSN